MNYVQRHCYAFGLFVTLGVIFLDQWSKWWVVSMLLTPEAPILEVFPFFHIVLVWNHGISFGMFAAFRQPVILVGISLVVIGILLVWLHKNTSVLVSAGLGLVMGGAMGNVWDRLHYGAVVDFLDFSLGEYHWPAFNIADSAIFIGVVLLSFHSMFVDDRTTKKDTKE